MSHCSTLSASQGRSWSAASVFTVRPGPTATVSAHRPRATRVRQASPPWAPGPRAPISAPVSNIKALSHRAKAETKAIFSARKRIWGKVMFLHLCVILFTGRGGFPACIIGHMTGGGVVCLKWGLHPGESLHTGGSEYRGGLHPEGLGRPPQDTWDTMAYGHQAGGMHPTGMHSCYRLQAEGNIFTGVCLSTISLMASHSLLGLGTCDRYASYWNAFLFLQCL